MFQRLTQYSFLFEQYWDSWYELFVLKWNKYYLRTRNNDIFILVLQKKRIVDDKNELIPLLNLSIPHLLVSARMFHLICFKLAQYAMLESKWWEVPKGRCLGHRIPSPDRPRWTSNSIKLHRSCCKTSCNCQIKSTCMFRWKENHRTSGDADKNMWWPGEG